jgi:hypothetical protein
MNEFYQRQQFSVLCQQRCTEAPATFVPQSALVLLSCTSKHFVPSLGLRICPVFDLQPIGAVLPVHTHLSFRHDNFQIAAADFVEQLFSPTLDVLRVQQPWTVALAYQFTEPCLALNERRAS